ncbi:MAG TPA: response regulator [Candidatus Dormibacteraeota bacterium]
MGAERLKVLIVDDDPLIAEMYRRRLEAAGCDVTIAPDGERGLAMANMIAPGFICLDYRLPGIDGLQALECLRADPATRAIPVILLSNDDDPSLRERGLRLGALKVGLKAEVTPGELADLIASGEETAFRSGNGQPGTERKR